MNKIIHLDKDKFELVKKGRKKFEIRLGNKNINSGDKLIIIQRDKNGNPTSNKIIKTAGYIESTKNIKYWSDKDINKLGLKIISLV
jgi:ASC-1-like (ASCH) protein